MKTKLLVITIMAVSLVSCKKDLLNLKPIDTTTVDIFYNSQGQIKQAVTGVYSGMSDWPVNIYMTLSEVRSNNLYGVTHDGQRDWWNSTTFTMLPQLSIVHDVWRNLYQMINRANQILQSIDNVKFDDPSLKTQYKAETRFLRALAYFQLVRIYGSVPLVKKVITPEEGIKIKQSKPADVYAFIISEMKAVADKLPASYDDADQGRITKWAAKGILAKVYLTMAGYPVKDNSKLNDAKTLLKQIMDQEGTYGWFAPNYQDLFKLANENKYFLLGIQFTSGGNGQGTQFPVYSIPNGIATSIYPFSAPLPWASRLGISPDLLSSYDSSDVRFNATIDTSYATNPTVPGGPPGHGNTPFFDKFMDPAAISTITGNDDWPDNFPLLRYADVMLMYAQIVNEQDGPTAEIVGILNKIRTRAGLDPINPTTKADFLKALNLEERHEFADEGQWWWYLIRTGQAVDVMNTWSNATSQGFTVNQNKLIYPIPQTEIDVYPDLYHQNPGY